MNNDTYDMLGKRHLFAKSSAGANKFHCPNCGKNDFEVKPSDGTYTCWSGGCSTNDIRAAIDKLEGKSDWKTEPRTVNRPIKSIRPKAEIYHYYPSREGRDLVRVCRKDDGQNNKGFPQSHWNGFAWASGNPDEFKRQVPIYRYSDVRQAINDGLTVFVVEGESCVNALWDIGIPATTTIGGSNKFGKYGDYSADFDGGKFILAPDCDAVGIKHMDEVCQFLGDKVQGYYLAGNSELWKDPLGGFDIKDDITDRHLDRDRILAKVISADEYRSILNPVAPKPVGRPRKPKDENEEKPIAPPELATMLADTVYKDLFRYESVSKQYWRYSSGLWSEIQDTDLFTVVQNFLDDVGNCNKGSRTIKEVIELARRHISVPDWIEPNGVEFIPFLNGVYELKTKNLLPHKPSFGFKWQLPRNYSDIKTGWGVIDRFLTETSNYNPQLKDILIAFCNAVLTGRSDLQKFLYMYGSGRNGKGAFLNLLSLMVGEQNICSTSIYDLNENRFESANIKDKRLVICADEDRRSESLSVFKSATGGDWLRAEQKGKQAINFKFKGIFVVAANKASFSGHNNSAIKDRKVDFPCKFKPKDEDKRDLTDEFNTELPFFTAYILSLDAELVKDIINKSGTVEAVSMMAKEMSEIEDPIAAFWDDMLLPESGSRILSADLYSSYVKYCVDNGNKSKSMRTFIRDIEELGKSMKIDIKLGRNNSKRHVEGLKFISVLDDVTDVSVTSVGWKTNPSRLDSLPSILNDTSDGLNPKITHIEKLNNRESNNKGELINLFIGGGSERDPSLSGKQAQTVTYQGFDASDTSVTNFQSVTPKQGDRVKIIETHQPGTIAQVYRIDDRGTLRLKIALDNGSAVHKHPREVVAIE